MWPGFKSRRRRHMWVEFVVGSLPCSERFFSGYSGFPLSPKTNTSKFQFDQESGRRGTTLWMCYLSIIIYLFIFYGTHRNQNTFFLDDEERKSRGSRRLKYGSSDKDHDEDEKDAAAAFDLDGDDDDNDDDGCDDNYDDESEEEGGSERQPKGKLFFSF